MSTSLNRRSFTRNTALASAGAIFAGIGFFRVADPGFSNFERQLIGRLSKLFPRILLRDLKTGTNRSLHASVSIDEINAFLDVDRRSAVLPDVKIYSEGNTLSFTHEGTSYRLDILLPEDFAEQTGEPVHI